MFKNNEQGGWLNTTRPIRRYYRSRTTTSV